MKKKSVSYLNLNSLGFVFLVCSLVIPCNLIDQQNFVLHHHPSYRYNSDYIYNTGIPTSSSSQPAQQPNYNYYDRIIEEPSPTPTFNLANFLQVFNNLPSANQILQPPTTPQQQQQQPQIFADGYPQGRVIMPIPTRGRTQGFPAVLNDDIDGSPPGQILGPEPEDDIEDLDNDFGFRSDLNTQEPNMPQIRLVAMNVDPHALTISGFSSGGAFVQQLLVSHPSMFKGAGIFHQTFYRCGGGGGLVEEFDFRCTNLPNPNFTTNEPRIPYDPQLAINDISTYFREGLIEDPRNLQNKRLYIYAGLSNPVFTIEMMMNIHKVLGPFIKNPEVIKTQVQDSQNLLPTKKYGGQCTESAETNFYVGNCNLDGAYEALSFLLGEKLITRPARDNSYNPNSFLRFDQTEYFEGINDLHFMASSGFIYIPEHCHAQQQQLNPHKCLFHVYFHGCRSGSDYVGSNHITRTGLLELADLNNIVILFPQVRRTAINTLGCWDSYGNTGEFYATQRGPQIIIVRRMIERILGSVQFNQLLSLSSSNIDNNNRNADVFSDNHKRNSRQQPFGRRPQQTHFQAQQQPTFGRQLSNLCKVSDAFSSLYLCHTTNNFNSNNNNYVF